MGLSVVISGGIMLSVIMMLFFTLPGLTEKMFSIGDITSQVAQFEKSISDTDISLESLFAFPPSGPSALVNFTLNNDDTEKLWNFDDFDVLIEYESASGDEIEELSFEGKCQGSLPPVGEWCIEGISGDFLDKGILNDGESAEIWTQVSKNLASDNARVTVSTDNGEVAMLPAPKRSWFDTGPVPTATCEFSVYGRTFVDTDTGISYVCDPSRDKWLSLETITIWGEEREDCEAGEDLTVEHRCSADFGDSMGPGRDILTGAGLYIPYNVTITAYGFSMDEDDTCDPGDSFDVELWGSGADDDDTQAFITTLGTILNDEDTDNNNSLDIDLDDQYISLGIDNNNGCGIIDEWNTILYMKWRHDDP